MKILIFLILLPLSVFAEGDDHDHDHEEKKSPVVGQCTTGEGTCDQKHEDEHKGEHSHGDEKEEKHADKDDHGHGEEGGHGHDEEEEAENAAIGPDKGIIAKGPDGFKLSPEAIKTFSYKTLNITSKVMTIPKQGLVHVKDEKFIYRVRDGWIKRVHVKILTKTPNALTIELPEVSSGDQVITAGNGFIRTTEIVVEEGVSHGHSH